MLFACIPCPRDKTWKHKHISLRACNVPVPPCGGGTPIGIPVVSRHCQMVTWAHFHAYRDLCRSHSGTPSYMLAGSQHYHTGVWSTCSCICHIPVSSCCGTPSYSSAVSKCCHMVQPGLFMHAVSPYTLVVSQCRHMVAWALLSVHVPCPALPCGSLGPHCPCTCCTWCQHVAA